MGSRQLVEAARNLVVSSRSQWVVVAGRWRKVDVEVERLAVDQRRWVELTGRTGQGSQWLAVVFH
jgi:ABC-type antimicrobial peptide transport system ATPase subunit